MVSGFKPMKKLAVTHNVGNIRNYARMTDALHDCIIQWLIVLKLHKGESSVKGHYVIDVCTND